MGVAVLPREVAALVITSGVARAAWAVSATSLALTIPMLTEYLTSRGVGAALPMPLGILAAMLALAVAGAINPTPAMASVFLLVGAVGAVLYEVTLIAQHPPIADEAFVLLNRPAVSLVLVGVGSSSTLIGLSWTLIGFLFSSGVSFTVAGITDAPIRTGWGPLLMLGLMSTAYAALGLIQARQRRLIPDFEKLDRETRRLNLEENYRARLTAAMHDTLLNDLNLVINSPDELDPRVRERLRADVAKLTSTEWLRTAADVSVNDSQDVELRNRIMLMISDLQWRGLTVRVTGSGSGIYRLEPEVADALLDAVGAALENVLRHSGADVAELDLAYTATEITAIVSDAGVGFDRSAVASDRLGVRTSIEDRITDAGGTVRIWSSPDAGTSVMMTVPVLELIREHEDSTHRESGDGRA